jgi:23S rRNA pseudouridine1911/1915/1917 synthase
VALNRGWSYRAQVGTTPPLQTVLAHLAARYPHSTMSTWAARIAAGEVELSGRPAGAGDLLQAGDVVVWHRPPWQEPEVPRGFDVLHEDDDVVAVSKPSGLPTMPAGGFLEHTLLHVVRERFGDVRPLHRLGRFTSGVVLFARTPRAASALALAWRTHAVQKDYRALVDGVPFWDRLEVREPIGPVPHPRLGTVHAARAEGRASLSQLAVVERRAGAALLEVGITTGRPHQIRIHCACAGHPLQGDPLYVAGGQPRPDDPGLPGDGGYLLHAWRVRCAHPSGVGDLHLEAPVPPGLRRAAED